MNTPVFRLVLIKGIGTNTFLIKSNGRDRFIYGPSSPLSSTAALMFSGSGGTMGPSPCRSFMVWSSKRVTTMLGKTAMVKSVERTVPITSSLLKCKILLGAQYQGLKTWKAERKRKAKKST